MILDEHAVPDERDRRSDRQLAVELDRQGIHGDDADDAARLAADAHLGAGQVAPETVGIAHGDDSDPTRLLRDERAAVARALSRREAANLREVAVPAQRRLEPVHRRRLAEGRQPVERDPAASRIEMRLRNAERGGAVCDMADEVRESGGRLFEAGDLGPRELRVRIGRRQMAHQPDDLDRRRGKLGEPPPAHPGVQLQVHPDAFRVSPRP